MLKHILAAAAVLVSTSAFAHSEHDHGAAPAAAPATECEHGGALTDAELQLTAGHAVTAGELEIAGAFSRATLPNAPVGGAYLTITNKGTADDLLLSVTTSVAGKAEIHEMKMDGDVMRMNQVAGGLAIPAGETVKLEPGGYHLMLMELKQPLVEGQSFKLTLNFEKAGAVEIEVGVGSPAAKTPATDHSGHSTHSTHSQLSTDTAEDRA